MAATTTSEPPLDEIQWSDPNTAEGMQGIHNNSVLFYFSHSPFFDQTSNNAIVFGQALFNQSMYDSITTREKFEARLRSMSGLEFIVAQEPAETGPGAGTGVWVIRKQTRRKMNGLQDDIITVHQDYFVVGYNIYQAPSLSDILASRIASISTELSEAFKAAVDMRHPLKTKPNQTFADESIAIHLKYGGEYMDENPITGKPGEFHLTSTGRKEPPKALEARPAANQKAPNKEVGAGITPTKVKRKKSKPSAAQS